MITCALGEDHEVVRQGFRAILDDDPELKVVGDAGTGEAIIQLVRRENPDVLVCDLMLPDMTGLEVLRRLVEDASETRVIILSMHESEPYVLEALRSGARGYVLKSSDAAELKKAIREVMTGRRYLCPPLSERAIKSYVGDSDGGKDPLAGLTRREREAFRHTIQGRNSQEAADAMGISRRTVETHRANLMSKLGFHSRSELMRFAAQHGLL